MTNMLGFCTLSTTDSCTTFLLPALGSGTFRPSLPVMDETWVILQPNSFIFLFSAFPRSTYLGGIPLQEPWLETFSVRHACLERQSSGWPSSWRPLQSTLLRHTTVSCQTVSRNLQHNHDFARVGELQLKEWKSW